MVPKQKTGETKDEPNTGSFSSLSDLANFHLRTNATQPTGPGMKPPAFNLPKLASSSLGNSDKNLSKSPLALSLEKIMELKNLSFRETSVELSANSPITNQNWIVDLTSALKNSEGIPPTQPYPPKVKEPTPEIIIPRFIECDIEPLLENQITHDCEIDCSSILGDRLVIGSGTKTRFAGILCRRYRIGRETIRSNEYNQRKCPP